MRVLLPIIILFWFASNAIAAEQDPVVIEEWAVPWESGRPRDPFVAPDGSVWFVGQQNNYIGLFDPQSGEFTRHGLEAGTGPHNLIVGADGIVWFAGNRKGYIGRYDPKTDEFEKIVMPDGAANDPHTLVFDGREDHIWFTVQWGNFVGRLRLSDRKVDLIPVPTSQARPYGIVVDHNGTPWVALLGTNKLASVDPESLVLREHELPDRDAGPRRLGVTSDGQIYYVDFSRGYVGQVDPASGFVGEWQAPSQASSGPYGMVIDDLDRIWFVETGDRPNQMVGFSTKSESVISITEIPSGAGSVRHMYYHAPSRAIWFGTDANTIGRVIVPAK